MTEGLREAWGSEPTVDAVALLEQIRVGMDAILARDWRPELHQKFVQALADTKSALLAEDEDVEALIEVLDRPFPARQPKTSRGQSIRDLAEEWLQSRGAALRDWGLFAPPAVAMGPTREVLHSTPAAPLSSADFGPAIRLSGVRGRAGVVLITIDFEELPLVRSRPVLVVLLRNDTQQVVSDVRFDDASGVQAAEIALDPALIATRVLRVAVGLADL